jgi:hypothetical protein
VPSVTVLTTITDLGQKLRDRINRSRTQRQLLDRPADWNKLCSALDIVEDSDQALDAYLKQPETINPGLCYLLVYGALQVLQVQQDAVEQICRALGIPPTRSHNLTHIREIRSSAIGHPTAQSEKKIKKSNFIVQTSLSQYGFTLSTVYSDGTPYSSRQIDIPTLVELQRVDLRDALTGVVNKLDETEMKHRAEHQNEKLVDLFPDALSYSFSKIFAALTGSEYFALGASFLERVAEIPARLRQRLEKRGEWGLHDGVIYHYELLEYPVTELTTFFTDRGASKLNEKDAYIFCTFIREQLKHLRQIASEIDEQYDQDPTGE